MRSTIIILAGLGLIAGGAFGLYHAYSNVDAGSAGFSWASIMIGTMTLLYGFGQRVSNAMANPEDSLSEEAHTEIRALIQSMGTVAVADRKVRDAEIETIARIHKQMLGIEITADEVRDILEEFGPDFDITRRLERDRGQLSPTMKRTIVQSCHLVMISDLEIVPSEQNRVSEIGRALGFTTGEIDDLIATAGA